MIVNPFNKCLNNLLMRHKVAPQPLNIDVVAKKSGYSKWYLQRMFRTVMHQTLGEYIAKHAGKGLLRNIAKIHRDIKNRPLR
jgi:AraC-like DNA-binding protein